jgi:hypothetical protein
MTTPSDSTIARTLDDRAIEVAATELLGSTHCHRGEFNDAASLLERNVALGSELHIERVGPFILPAHAQAMLSYVLAQLGRFDEATGYADAAVAARSGGQSSLHAVLRIILPRLGREPALDGRSRPGRGR